MTNAPNFPVHKSVNSTILHWNNPNTFNARLSINITFLSSHENYVTDSLKDLMRKLERALMLRFQLSLIREGQVSH